MADLNIPVQSIIEHLTKRIGQLEYDNAVANAGLSIAREELAQANTKLAAQDKKA